MHDRRVSEKGWRHGRSGPRRPKMGPVESAVLCGQSFLTFAAAWMVADVLLTAFGGSAREVVWSIGEVDFVRSDGLQSQEAFPLASFAMGLGIGWGLVWPSMFSRRGQLVGASRRVWTIVVLHWGWMLGVLVVAWVVRRAVDAGAVAPDRGVVVFAGWCLIGLVVSLVARLALRPALEADLEAKVATALAEAQVRRPCSRCGELVRVEARRCEWCERRLGTVHRGTPPAAR
ncbi:hypothetical protein FTX61_14440 [Nitriliruptoraceae bacterium ZYF776]|nr:hypothetical protein [Profundirhabdus halotolerans]